MARHPEHSRLQPHPALAPGRILVVDDQPANLRAVSTLLARSGYEVLTASDGEEALAAGDRAACPTCCCST